MPDTKSTKTRWSKDSKESLRSDEERNQLAIQWIGLCKKLVLKFVHIHHKSLQIQELGDWLQDATVSLLKAASFYDTSRLVDGESLAFSTLAYKVVWRDLMEVYFCKGLIHTPHYIRKETAKYAKEAKFAWGIRLLSDTIRDSLVDRTNPIQELESNENLQYLTDLIDNLPEPHRTRMRQRWLEGKTLKQIGDLNGCNKESVRKTMKVGVKMMKKRMEKQLCV